MNIFIFCFRYLLNVTKIEPATSASSGGLEVVVYGSEFGKNIEDVKVVIGNASCIVKKVDSTTIHCTTTKNAAGTADLNVSFGYFGSNL